MFRGIRAVSAVPSADSEAMNRSIGFLTMPDTKPPIGPKELKPLMYWAGLSLHACQQFEYGIKFLLVVMAETGFAKVAMPDAVAVIENRDRKTLGQLLKLLKRTVTISDGWLDALEGGLSARNNIIHRFLIENTDRIVDPETRPGAVAELKKLRKLVLAGDRAVREMIETVYASRGIDWQAMEHSFREEARALNPEHRGKKKGLCPGTE